MAIRPYLAMTPGELRRFSVFSFPIAWMACHFSPGGKGLADLPEALPEGALLMLDDSTPPRGHDPVFVAEQLRECGERLSCRAVVLDFQRPDQEETAAMAKAITSTLPCPVAVSQWYAKDLPCPVFLPPVPPSVTPEDWFRPWKGRDIWLELGLEGELLTLTEQGCSAMPLPCPAPEEEGFSDRKLHCRYTVEVQEHVARFTLWRTAQDLDDLLEDSEKLGVVGAVGLYQELGKFAPHLSLPCVKGGGTAKP